MAPVAGRETNFDGLVGPTHNYAGLAEGNLAAATNRSRVSSPREAARQGLRKMRRLVGLGLSQAVLPPQERPHLGVLRALGFGGSDADVLSAAGQRAPGLLAGAASASSMWAANAATVTPSKDAGDGRLHLTPANLQHHFHRSLEAEGTARALRAIFPDPARFQVHDPLPSVPAFGDEGAANHTRLCRELAGPGVHVFVWGRHGLGRTGSDGPSRFPARQTREASEAIARRHGIPSAAVVFVQQSPRVIDAGVFHNDVIAVGHRDVLLVHEAAWVDQGDVLRHLAETVSRRTGAELRAVVVPEAEVGIADAVRSYLFNTQLLSLPDGSTVLLAPEECRETASVAAYLERLASDPHGPIDDVLYEDVRESMRNGGGPACLRLRVEMDDAERAAIHPGVLVDDARLDRLDAWVDTHYRDRLAPDDLRDPALLDESRRALEELTQILELGPIYDFMNGC